MPKNIPRRGSRWTHKNQHMKYTFLFLTNELSKSNKHTVTAVYLGDNGNLWSRPLSTWHDSMISLEEK